MYQGDNPTAIQSKNWFAEAMIRLLRDKRYKDITIRMLCNEADLSRQTFYNLFNDKDEVILYYLESSHKDYFKMIKFKKNIEIRTFVESFASYIKAQDEVLKIITKNHLELLLSQAIANGINEVAVEYSTEQNTKYGTAFLSGALTQTILCWIYDEDRISIDELVNILEQILTGKYYTINSVN